MEPDNQWAEFVAWQLAKYPFPCPPGEVPLYGQKDVCRHMLEHPRSFVLSDTRTGKTRPAIWAADLLMGEAEPRLRCLIVCDIIALAKTWETEIRLCLLGKRRAVNLTGTAKARIQNLASLEVDFYLINPEGLRIPAVRDALVARPDIQICIFDEATTYRNAMTGVSRAARQVSQDRLFCWGMTGTPSPNGPLDAYGLKRLVHPDYKWGAGLFFSYRIWQDAVTRASGPFLRIPRPEAPQLVDKLLSPAIHIARAKVFTETELDLPPPILAPLTAPQIKYMKELKRQLLIQLENGTEIGAVNQASLRSKLIQIACGLIYDGEHYFHKIDTTPRYEVLDELLAKSDGKSIVLAPFTATVKMLYERYKDKGLYMASDLTRTGKIDLLNRFRDDKSKKVIFANPGPIARGINLTCADTIVWYSATDRAEWWLQSNQRTNGPEQTQIRHIYRIAGSQVELEIYQRLEMRQDMLNVILRLKDSNFDNEQLQTMRASASP